MGHKRVSILDVARTAGVSPATVSLVMHGSPLVKEATRERVQGVINQLGYQSHAAASALRLARSNTLGYLVPKITEAVNDVFRHQLISAVTTRAAEANYHVLFDTFLNAQHHTALFSSGRIDGVLVDWEVDDAVLAELHARNIPFVLLGRQAPGWLPVSSVKADEFNGSYDIIWYLITHGHTRIALLSAGSETHPIAQERITGYYKAFAQAGLPVDPASIVTGNWDYASGFEQGLQLLSLHPRPTAIFALSELMAVGALKAALRLGLKVPDELSIVTTEDSPWVEYVLPELTAVHIPMYEVGIRSTELLLAQLANPQTPPQHIVLPTTLIMRESSAPI